MLEFDPNAHLIQRHVAKEAHRCDRMSAHREGAKDPRHQEIVAKAWNQHRNDRNLLRRNSGTHPAVADVLARLETCGPGTRCGSGACAACNTTTRLAILPLFSDVVRRHTGSWSYVTIVNTRRTIPQGELAQHRLHADFEPRLHESSLPSTPWRSGRLRSPATSTTPAPTGRATSSTHTS